MKAIDFAMTQELWALLDNRRLLNGRWGEFASIAALYARGNPFSVDRSGTLDVPFLLSLFPIPSYDAGFAKTVPQLCAERGAAITAEGKPIKVYWSGGIDSTLALLSLRATMSAGQVTVVCTNASAAEAPALYAELSTLGFIVDNRGSIMLSGVDTDTASLHVTGELGDFISNCISQHRVVQMREMAPQDRLAAPWRDAILSALPQYRVQFQTEPAMNAGQADALEALVAACPFTIQTVHQYIWWRNFTTRWQGVWMRMGRAHDAIQFAGYMTNVRHFYDTADFQRWSMVRTRDNPIAPAQYIDFKREFKDAIYLLWTNADYYNTKAGQGSLNAALLPWGRFEDYTVATTALEARQKLQQRYP